MRGMEWSISFLERGHKEDLQRHRQKHKETTEDTEESLKIINPIKSFRVHRVFLCG